MTRSSSPTSARTRCCCIPTPGSRASARRTACGSLKAYVERGGGLLMVGGYYSFQGINGGARYHGTPVEEVLPVEILPYDDRVEVPEGFAPVVKQQGAPDPRRLRRRLAAAARLQRGQGEARRRGARDRVGRLWRQAAARRRHLRQGPHARLDLGHRPALAAARVRRLARLRAALAAGAGVAGRRRDSASAMIHVDRQRRGRHASFGWTAFRGPARRSWRSARAEDLGGKGANQAIAVARCGARFASSRRSAPTPRASAFARASPREGVVTDGLAASSYATDRCVITVDAGGENTIVSLIDAARAFDPIAETAARAMDHAGRLGRHAGQSASERHARLPRAGARRRARRRFSIRRRPIAARRLRLDARRSCRRQPRRGGRTRPAGRPGRGGARALREGRRARSCSRSAPRAPLSSRPTRRLRVAAPRVAAVDTVGAGDVFCGVLIAAAPRGCGWREALADRGRGGGDCRSRGAASWRPFRPGRRWRTFLSAPRSDARGASAMTRRRHASRERGRMR